MPSPDLSPAALAAWLDHGPTLSLGAFLAVPGLLADPGYQYQTCLARLALVLWGCWCHWPCCTLSLAWLLGSDCVSSHGCEPEPPTGTFRSVGELQGMLRLVIQMEENRANRCQVFSN